MASEQSNKAAAALRDQSTYLYESLLGIYEKTLPDSLYTLAIPLTALTLSCGIIIFCYVFNLLIRRALEKRIRSFVEGSKTDWDNILFDNRFFERLTHIASGVVAFYAARLLLDINHSVIADVFKKGVSVYLIFLFTMVIDAFLNAVIIIYRKHPISRDRPIKGYIQTAKIITYSVCVILVLSTIMEKNPKAFLTGMGAMTAVIMLVFKDPILNFAASIQLTANNMIRIGDWVELPQYGADGSVIEISISAVKIQNWDKTISTIPPYALLTSSFKNWRGMTESGGRRIMRSILLDMNSVCFCDEEMLTRFARIKYIAEHIENKRLELQSYNHEKQLDNEDLVNQRRLTNIGIFRTYVIAYLKNHPKINQEMTFLVRQLEPLPHGIPIQIYVFCKEKAWANYEGIQADIFDHLLAIVPEFNLRVFQNPSGRDFATLTQLHQHSAGSSNNH